QISLKSGGVVRVEPLPLTTLLLLTTLQVGINRNRPVRVEPRLLQSLGKAIAKLLGDLVHVETAIAIAIHRAHPFGPPVALPSAPITSSVTSSVTSITPVPPPIVVVTATI